MCTLDSARVSSDPRTWSVFTSERATGGTSSYSRCSIEKDTSEVRQSLQYRALATYMCIGSMTDRLTVFNLHFCSVHCRHEDMVYLEHKIDLSTLGSVAGTSRDLLSGSDEEDEVDKILKKKGGKSTHLISQMSFIDRF